MHGYDNGFPIEGCAPDPNHVNPYSELARRDPIVAIAIEQARETGAAVAESRFARHDVNRLEHLVSETEDKLDRTKRELTYARNDVSSLRDDTRTLEAKVKRLTPKTVKKAKKVSKK